MTDDIPTGRPVQLRDGSTVLLRPVTQDDKPRFRAAFERLSPESRYRRFLTPVTELTESQLAYLTEVDHHDHEAIMALLPESGEGLGVARFVRLGEGTDLAEAAVVVVDDWQGRGLGTALLQALADRAREEGIRRFRCLMLAENHEMAELLRSLGPIHETERQTGTVEFEAELPLPEEGLGAELATVLRSAASQALEVLHRARQ